MVPPCLHRIDDRAQAFADFSQRVFDVVVNAVGAWTEETLPAIPNTAKHLADVLAGTDVRTISVRFWRNGHIGWWVAGVKRLDVCMTRAEHMKKGADGFVRRCLEMWKCGLASVWTEHLAAHHPREPLA